MAVFLPQAQIQAPRNAMLDMSPLTNAIDSNRRNAMLDRQMTAEQEHRKATLGIQQEQLGMQRQRFNADQEKTKLFKLGNVLAAIDSSPPDQQGALYQRLRQTIPDFDADLTKNGIDPNNYQMASQALLRMAGQHGWKLEEDAKRAQIDASRASADASRAHAGLFRQQASLPPVTSKPPAGYRTTADGNLQPIPGGPADTISGEQAARVGLMTNGLGYLPEVRKVFLGEKVPGTEDDWQNPVMGMGVGSHFDFQLDRGDIADAKRKMAVGIEGVLRAQTGAAATADEVNRELAKYLPRPEDTVETRKRKLKLYEDTIRRTISLSTRGVTATGLQREVQQMSPPQQSPAPQMDQVLNEARDAIQRGAPREQVIERLRGMGLDPTGL